MKKLIFFLLTTLLIVGCSTNETKIVGNVQNLELSGKTIYFKEKINREWITIDSVQILNGTFQFKKVCDTAKIVYLICELPSGDKIRQAFVFEAGEINISIDSIGKVYLKGTKQNNLFQSYLDQKNELYQKGEHIFSKLEDSTLTADEKSKQEIEMEKLETDETKIDLDFSNKNVNTLIGTHVFTTSFHGMTIDEKESVIKLMNNDTKKVKRVSEIIANIDIEKRTSAGNQFSDFKLPSLTGDSMSLSDFVGKTDYILVDFWASWCGPCMQFLPELKDFYAKNKGSKFEILGVSFDDNMEAWKSTITKNEISWKHVSDLKGWKSEAGKIYAVNSIPATVLIDKNGKILGRNLSIQQIDLIISKSATNIRKN